MKPGPATSTPLTSGSASSFGAISEARADRASAAVNQENARLDLLQGALNSEDIRRRLEGLPIQARPDTLVYRAGKFARRHRLGLAAVTAVFLALAKGRGGLRIGLGDCPLSGASDG